MDHESSSREARPSTGTAPDGPRATRARSGSIAPAARPPPGLVVAAFACAAWAALTALVLPLAAYGALPLSLGGAAVPPYVWMRVAAPLVAIAAILMAAFAAGIAARRAWSRPLPLLLGCTVALYGLGAWRMGAVPGALGARAALEGGLLAAASLWYFYRKGSVVAYYRSIEHPSDDVD